MYADFVPERAEITTKLEEEVTSVTLHDGGQVHLRKVDDNYDPTDRNRAATYVRQHQEMGEIVTGLLYINDHIPDLHESSDTVETPLVDLEFTTLNPGSSALDSIQKRYTALQNTRINPNKGQRSNKRVVSNFEC